MASPISSPPVQHHKIRISHTLPPQEDILSSSGFSIDITQAATPKGTLAGEIISGFPVTLTASNNQIRVKVDGKGKLHSDIAGENLCQRRRAAAEIQRK